MPKSDFLKFKIGPERLDTARYNQLQASSGGISVRPDYQYANYHYEPEVEVEAEAIGGGGNGLNAAMSILGGGMDILQTALRSSQIEDVSRYDNALRDMRLIGMQDYGTYGQVMQDYDRLNASQLGVDAKDIRGMTTGQKVGSIASTTASGAMTGLTVGGPWGALAGAVVGAGAGVGGVVAGDQKAKREAMRLNYASEDAQLTGAINLSNAMENLQDYNYRKGVAHRVAEGGPIKRRQMSLKEFAATALKKPLPPKDYSRSGIVHKKCNGGTMIRIKR